LYEITYEDYLAFEICKYSPNLTLQENETIYTLEKIDKIHDKLFRGILDDKEDF